MGRGGSPPCDDSSLRSLHAYVFVYISHQSVCCLVGLFASTFNNNNSKQQAVVSWILLFTPRSTCDQNDKPTLAPCRSSGLRMRASFSGLLEPCIARQAVVVAYSIGQRQVLASRVSSTPRERGYDIAAAMLVQPRDDNNFRFLSPS